MLWPASSCFEAESDGADVGTVVVVAAAIDEFVAVVIAAAVVASSGASASDLMPKEEAAVERNSPEFEVGLEASISAAL